MILHLLDLIFQLHKNTRIKQKLCQTFPHIVNKHDFSDEERCDEKEQQMRTYKEREAMKVASLYICIVGVKTTEQILQVVPAKETSDYHNQQQLRCTWSSLHYSQEKHPQGGASKQWQLWAFSSVQGNHSLRTFSGIIHWKHSADTWTCLGTRPAEPVPNFGWLGPEPKYVNAGTEAEAWNLSSGSTQPCWEPCYFEGKNVHSIQWTGIFVVNFDVFQLYLGSKKKSMIIF